MQPYHQHMTPQDTGWIEVITGCMFSGKTEELIRRLRRAQIAKYDTILFKAKIDDRYSETNVVSHSEQKLPSINVETSDQIFQLSKSAQVIGIDEAHFFDLKLVDVANDLADMGKRVIITGLDTDYTGKPFEPVPNLLAVAEYITKTLAICVNCGNPADRTQRKVATEERVLVGANDLYEARCRKCHYIPNPNELKFDF